MYRRAATASGQGGWAARSYARQGAKTLPGTEGNDHKFNGPY